MLESMIGRLGLVGLGLLGLGLLGLGLLGLGLLESCTVTQLIYGVLETIVPSVTPRLNQIGSIQYRNQHFPLMEELNYGRTATERDIDWRLLVCTE